MTSYIVLHHRYWAMYPRLIPPEYFDILYDKVGTIVDRYPIKIWGKVFTSRRLSCVYSNFRKDRDGYTYGGIPELDWNDAPLELVQIRKVAEYLAGVEIDYVLIHLYADGSDYIGWHADNEALKTPIVSVSLGAERIFRFRKIEEKKGWSDEYLLKSGDVLVMYGPKDGNKGCQEVYKHTVPATKKPVGPRINLTFRCFS